MNIRSLHVVASRRPGKPVRWYVYAWRGGPQIKVIVGGPKPSLKLDDVEVLNLAVETRRGAEGSFGRLIEDWRHSPEWAAMAASTRAEWARVLDLLPTKWMPLPLALFDDPRTKDAIAKWRDPYADRPRRADYLVQVLRGALAWGQSRGRLRLNIADGIPKLWEGGKHAAVIWTPEERAVWATGNQPVHDAIELACLTGLRRGDLVRLPWSAVGEHAIVWKTAKGKIIALIPLYPKLRAHLDVLRTRHRAEGVDTVLVSGLGRSRSPAGLTAQVDRERERLGLDGKRLHDARGTFATELYLAGYTSKQIAKTIGWSESSVDKILSMYVDQEAVVIDLAERLENRSVKHPVKHSP